MITSTKDDPFATCEIFKKCLNDAGWLGDHLMRCCSFCVVLHHINEMLLFMRQSTSLSARGKWTTTDTRFKPDPENKFKYAGRYADGDMPICSKPWKDTWCGQLFKKEALGCIKFKDEKIIIYDSIRPTKTTHSDGVDKEIIATCECLTARRKGGIWKAVFEEDLLPPQQEDGGSCGVYALSRVSHQGGSSVMHKKGVSSSVSL
ncbi:hypothetical protein MKX01_036107 [Papaver californicum]|nr:hypothetical protein MKX01_036107 [Papaver californicum]